MTWLLAYALTQELAGRIRFTGVVPAPERIRAPASHGGPFDRPRMRVDAGTRALADVVVDLRTLQGRPALPIDGEPGDVTLRVTDREFEPAILVMPVGRTLVLESMGRALHMVHARCRRNAEFNMTVAPGARGLRAWRPDTPEAVPLTCD